jgi:hypothetical protein
MDKLTILAIHDFGRARLLGTLDAIEKSGQDVAKVLAWRPGPGRAHIGWQAMHCAATHDRYLHKLILSKPVADEALCADFGGGSTPSDTNVPTLDEIRSALNKTLVPVKAYIQNVSADELAKVQTMPNGSQRTVGESLLLLAWHEAHHQGQIHLTWNLYKAAHGVA